MDNYGAIRTNWFEGFTTLILIHPSGEVEGRAENESFANLYKGIFVNLGSESHSAKSTSEWRHAMKHWFREALLIIVLMTMSTVAVAQEATDIYSHTVLKLPYDLISNEP